MRNKFRRWLLDKIAKQFARAVVAEAIRADVCKDCLQKDFDSRVHYLWRNKNTKLDWTHVYMKSQVHKYIDMFYSQEDVNDAG